MSAQLGLVAESEQFFRKAIDANPNAAGYPANLASLPAQQAREAIAFIGAGELPAAFPKQYVQSAMNLPQDLSRLAETAAIPCMPQPPRMDSRPFARNVECAYRQMLSEMTPDETLVLARQHYQAGRLREAEVCYRQVLEQQARSCRYHEPPWPKCCFAWAMPLGQPNGSDRQSPFPPSRHRSI